jgi:glutamate dehydrogenase
LRNEIEALPVEGRWHAQARGSLLDELNQQHRELAIKVLAWSDEHKSSKPVRDWLDRDDATLKYTRATLGEIMSQRADYPIASVAVRRLAQLAHAA